MQMDTLLQHRRMSESTKRPRDEATEPVATCKKTKSISFSISSILGHMDNIQETGAVARGEATVKREANNSPLSVAIEHQLPYGKENYSDFKSAINNRACSTPEDDECPSPTLPVPQYGSLLPPQHVVLLDEKFSYGHPALTSCGHMALTSVYAGVPLRPSFTRYQPYRTPSLDSVGDRRQTSPGNTSDDFTPRSESHSRLSDFPSTDAPSIPPNYRHVNHSDHGLDSLGESYHNSPSPLKCRKKKTRTVFSRNQIYQLESAFDLKRYLSTAERASLAGRLQLSETQVKIWFQNRRNKWKRQISGEMDEIPLPPAFHMQGLISPPFSHQPISAYPSMVDPRDEMIRGRMLVPSIYPSYSQESRFLPPVL